MCMTLSMPSLRMYTRLGVYEWEKKEKREIVLNLELKFDGSKASKSDSLEDTIDYDSLVGDIESYLDTAEFELIEALGEALLDIILKNKLIKKVKLEIQKPGAIKQAPYVAIQFKRSR